MEAAINFAVPLYIQIIQGRYQRGDVRRHDAVHVDGLFHRHPGGPLV
jgi:hypothetical protein